MTIRQSPRKNVASVGIAMLKWPKAMMTPPTNTLRYCPSKRSAIHPPGMAAAYTPKPYHPTIPEAFSEVNASPPLATDAVM